MRLSLLSTVGEVTVLQNSLINIELLNNLDYLEDPLEIKEVIKKLGYSKALNEEEIDYFGEEYKKLNYILSIILDNNEKVYLQDLYNLEFKINQVEQKKNEIDTIYPVLYYYYRKLNELKKIENAVIKIKFARSDV